MTKAQRILGGLTFGEIPIAGSKRRSIAIQLQGRLYRIGRIPANKAFVVIRGNLRLLYVCPRYRNYRRAARKVFGKSVDRFEVDHVLGRELTKSNRYWYTLVAQLDRTVNRSHGPLERPGEVPDLNLDKFCYTDDRILAKAIGIKGGELPAEPKMRRYSIAKSHARPLGFKDALKVRRALGMNGRRTGRSCLTPIER